MIFELILEFILYFLSGLVKRKKNRIIFGAWGGEKYSDNSKYMFEYLMNYEEYELIWCGQKNLEKNIPVGSNTKFVEYGTLKSYYYAFTSSYAFITHSYQDITKLNVLKGSVIVLLWHGVGLKKFGSALLNDNKIVDRFKKKKQQILRNYDYFICSSEKNMLRNLSTFEFWGIKKGNIIKSGQPRNDLFFKYNDKDLLRSKFKEKYLVPTDKLIITYLPTFRKNKKNRFTFSNVSKIEKEKLEKLCQKYDFVILEKSHNHDLEGWVTQENANCDFIYNLGNYSDIDTQEILLISDILITDYSSCYMDYTLLDRPIIHFAYDYDKKNFANHGFYYDLYDYAAGEIVYDFNGLINSLSKVLNNPGYLAEKRRAVRAKMMEYEKGQSCKIIAEKIGLDI